MKRNTIEIKVWMARNKIKVKDIVEATGRKQGHVSNTLIGRRNNQDVLRFLSEKGCPEEYLAVK